MFDSHDRLRDEFYSDCMSLVVRDGNYRNLGENGYFMWLRVDGLQISLMNDSMTVFLVGETGPFKMVLNEDKNSYNVDLVSEWLPILKPMLVLEILADI